MQGSVSLHGLRTAYLSRKSTGHRSLSSLSPEEALPHGYPRQSSHANTLAHANQCKGLADLCRLCPDPYYPCSTSLYQRFFWSRVESNCLCSGLHHDRSLSFTFSMGQIPKAQGSSINYNTLLDLRGSIPSIVIVTPWESSRCNHSGSTDLRTERFLHLRSRVSRFYSPLCDPTILGIFCDQKPKAISGSNASILGPSTNPRSPNRPNYRTRRLLLPESLSRQTATDSLFRRQSKQTVGLLDHNFTYRH